MLPQPPPLPPATRTGLIPVNGVEIHFEVFGSDADDPVLMLHGGLGSVRDWGFQIPALAAGRTVIAIDSRGHGRSTLAGASITYRAMTADTVGVMDALAVARASIVGWSDGGIIGLLMAIEHPARTARLFAFGANYNTDGLKTSIAEDPTLRAAADIQRAFYEQVSLSPDGFDTLVRHVHAMWESEPNIAPSALRSIRTPTTIADGDRNEAVRPEHTAELARLIPNAELVIIPGHGDFAPWQDPIAFNDALANFIDK